jgi:sec-independent protein translocase protein TatC
MAKKLKRNVVLDHLEELRWLLVRYYCNLILQPLLFFVSDYIFDVIILGPTNANFVTYRFFVTCLINWVSPRVFV